MWSKSPPLVRGILNVFQPLNRYTVDLAQVRPSTPLALCSQPHFVGKQSLRKIVDLPDTKIAFSGGLPPSSQGVVGETGKTQQTGCENAERKHSVLCQLQ